MLINKEKGEMMNFVRCKELLNIIQSNQYVTSKSSNFIKLILSTKMRKGITFLDYAFSLGI